MKKPPTITWSPVIDIQAAACAHQIAQTQRVIQQGQRITGSRRALTDLPTPKKTPGGLGNKVNSALKKHTTDGDSESLNTTSQRRLSALHIKQERGNQKKLKSKSGVHFYIDQYHLFHHKRCCNALPHVEGFDSSGGLV